MTDTPVEPGSNDPIGGDEAAGLAGGSPPAVPRWVKVSGIIAAVVVVLIIILLLTGGPGRHGPGRHGPPAGGGGATSPAADVTPPAGGHVRPTGEGHG